MKKEKVKESIIKELSEMPIVQFACKKVGVSRSTYYRWRKNSKKFTTLTDNAIREGLLFLNDITESQLISAIKDRNMSAITFWLRHHHKAYSNKVDLSLNNDEEVLTEKQKRLIEDALLLSSTDLMEMENGKTKENSGDNQED